MHDAGLHDRLWKDRVDRFWKALQTVNHSNENVAGAPGPQFIHDPQPKFGAFGGFDPQAQNVLCSIRRNAERDIDGLVAHQPLVADLTRKASKKISGYIASSGRFCHSATVSRTASVIVETRSGETSRP